MTNPGSSNLTSERMLFRRQRRSHHKVKTGCNACKTRHHKCDEERPVCSSCRRHSTECIFTDPLHASSLAKPLSLSEINFDDLELLHHWLTSTCIAAGQLPEMTVHVQKAILPVARAYTYAMRGILAMAATHLALLKPVRRTHYTTLAVKNHQCGLADFQFAVQDIHKDNYLAVISYAKSLLWCSLADDSTIQKPESACLELNVGDNWLPTWFRLLRGSCHVVEASRAWLREGPHVLTDISGFALDYYGSEHPDNVQMSELISQMQPLMTASSTCETVFLALRAAFARASMHILNTPLRDGINFWVASLPDEFFTLLRMKEPWTMVALVHLCILIHRLESLEFQKGHAKRLVLEICDELDAGLSRLVRWPCREVGMQPSAQ